MSLEIIDQLQTLNGKANIDTITELFNNIDSTIKIKQYNNNDSLFLIYNNYDSKNDTIIYGECKSFTLQIKDDNATIVSYVSGTVKNCTIESFTSDEHDTFTEAYEGTMITVFNVDNTWYFNTPRCTNIDESYYYNAKTTFGNMFDECLKKLDHDRESFTDSLEKPYCYGFTMLHHNNKYIIDYTDDYGDDYAKLVIVNKRHMNHFLSMYNFDMDDVITPKEYWTLESCTNSIKRPENIICRRNDQCINIQTPEYIRQCKRKPKYANIWHSYIQIFLNNDTEQTIDMFRKEHNIDTVYEIDGQETNITGMISLLYTHTATILMNLVKYFTTFNYSDNTYTKINNIDYMSMNDTKYTIIKKQIATIQSLVRNGTVRTTYDIVQNMKKFCSVKQFISILYGIQSLKTMDFCNLKNKYYENYLNYILNC
jgi:hypothetical protein